MMKSILGTIWFIPLLAFTVVFGIRLLLAVIFGDDIGWALVRSSLPVPIGAFIVISGRRFGWFG